METIKEYSDYWAGIFGNCYEFAYNNHCLQLSNELMPVFVQIIGSNISNFMLLDICGVDNLHKKNRSDSEASRFEKVYHLLDLDYHQRIRVKLPVDENDQASTIIDNRWKASKWYLQESWDLFGIESKGVDKKRLLTHNQFTGHPLRKDYELLKHCELTEIFYHPSEEASVLVSKAEIKGEKLDILPHHQALKGSMRLLAEVEGELIQKSDLEIGYNHRGVEKICENKSYKQLVHIVGRLNPQSPAMYTTGICKAMEDLLEIEIPDRAKAIRMILMELSRVIDHFLCIGQACNDLTLTNVFSLCLNARESVLEFFQDICGYRLNLPLNCIGGLAKDMSSEQILACSKVIQFLDKTTKQVEYSLTRSPTWIKRLKVGHIKPSDAVSWGYTGPCLRASGVNYDIRKRSPYYFYDQVDFDVPLGVHGDCYDRYLVRLEEIKQSIKIIKQILNYVPVGDILNTSVAHEAIDIKPAEIYSGIEVAGGELGFYIVSDGDDKPYRLKIRTPGFPILQSINEIISGELLSDALSIIGSMNIIPSEVDR
ncbi:MAG: NADH-quinone oxidoreductase subunit D [Bacteriovoracaceae bacterium]|nr:NADH-quinone oxidoreductase subunit D [Bacteriovoracaceae bacterium]